ncbi:MAG: hypothetical protein QOH59_1516 [Gemmatimonadales bacterium]|jgi:uncharacterized membrane protein YkoI|nr:hypothetical protein [Gemmatimonadales bacterium]
MKRLAIALILVACHRGSAASGSDSGSIKEESPGLAAEAKIDPAAARRTALAKFPDGKIVKEEIEKENGKLVYSFDIKNGKQSGIDEVLVDATGGTVVSVDHEDAAQEAAEAKKE